MFSIIYALHVEHKEKFECESTFYTKWKETLFDHRNQIGISFEYNQMIVSRHCSNIKLKAQMFIYVVNQLICTIYCDQK